jgi:hypothetical protein
VWWWEGYSPWGFDFIQFFLVGLSFFDEGSLNIVAAVVVVVAGLWWFSPHDLVSLSSSLSLFLY